MRKHDTLSDCFWSCERDLKGRAQTMTVRSLTEVYETRRGEPMGESSYGAIL
ncbi:MAG: hypothetical protein PUE11_05850 [Paraprevotella sp.]|nr:hypothetical protein [Paraprevotella sp.]